MNTADNQRTKKVTSSTTTTAKTPSPTKKPRKRNYQVLSPHDDDHEEQQHDDDDEEAVSTRNGGCKHHDDDDEEQQHQHQKEALVAERFDDEIPHDVVDDANDVVPSSSRSRQQHPLNINDNDDEYNDIIGPSSVIGVTNQENGDSSNHRISFCDAWMHLMKGNLGPGCLNIPHAFVLSGWLLGTALFGIVAIQGIYSMYILTYCKDLLMKKQQNSSSSSRQQRQRGEEAEMLQVQRGGTEQQNSNEHLPSPAPPPPPSATASVPPTRVPPPRHVPEISRRQLRQPRSSSLSFQDDTKYTFMTVAQKALGSKIHVQIFLFALQVGVCCVFLSLLSTNLQAQLPRLSSTTSVLLVTTALLGIVLQRHLKGLRWLSTTANCMMITAILTACVFGITEYRAQKRMEEEDPNHYRPKAKVATDDWGDIATFISAMFFSFEGIGLVLPVENSFTAGYTTLGDISKANNRYRKFVLPGAMSSVAVLFVAIGLSASLGYPDIENGSITAYLKEKYPDNVWLDIVNVLVMVAVFFTFPLQLTPAMEVLEEWLYGEHGESCCKASMARIIDDCGLYHFQSDEETPAYGVPLGRVDSTDQYRADALLEEVQPDYPPDEEDDNERHGCCYYYRGYCCSLPTWVIQRYMVIFGCTVVVLVVNDLGLLMSLFGAVGQTGLALMPCVIHWNLQKQGIAPQNRLLTCLDIFTISFSGLVMITGVGFSIQKLLLEKQ